MLTSERLREFLEYNPETGEFKWLCDRNGVKAGDVAGRGKRYGKIQIDGVTHSTHRLVWLYVFGKWPAAYIDHINRDRLDNRLSNLREATPEQNMRSGKHHYLGRFITKEAAAEAYAEAARQLHGEFAHFGS